MARYGGRIIYLHKEEAGEPEPGPALEELPLKERLREALRARGIRRLYRFQAEALDHIAAGRHTMIVSGTGTGKTEAFLVPILQSALDSERAPHAILVYPTKALARDQLRRIRPLMDLLGMRAAVLDGDTPAAERREIYANPPHLLVSNPDMIHYSLAFQPAFRELVSKAQYLVLDEFHQYSGVFGSHVRWVVRRLQRYSPELVMIGAGATIGNPREIGEKVLGRRPEVVLGPQRRKGVAYHYLVDVGRASRWTLAAAISFALSAEGMKVLTFTDSQQMAELVARIIRKQGGAAEVHRAGLSADHRKRVEEAFASGQLNVLVATPTLELGIDIGDLDAVIMASMPKSYASYLQRAGRTGRRGKPGYVFTILGDDAMEAYFAARPREFFQQEIPASYIEPSNEEVARVHLAAMLLENLALLPSELAPELQAAVEALVKEGSARFSRGRLYGNPQRVAAIVKSSNLRSSGPMVRIMEEEREIGTREMPLAMLDLHPGAIYYHGGTPYAAISLDLASMRAAVKRLPQDVSFYTRPLYTMELDSVKPELEREVYGVKLVYGKMRVTMKVEGYVIKEEQSGALISEVPLEAPLSWSYWTKGLVGRYPDPGLGSLPAAASSYHALEHVLIAAAKPVAGIADTDVGGISYPSGHIAIYDSAPGGNGASRLIFERMEKVVEVAEKILAGCNCYDGCPRCVFSPYCGNNNRMLSRQGALRVARAMKEGVAVEAGSPEGYPLA
ncbi:MAG: DEAD/DEAH box helicase [Acidilobaceae archaeon]|nr:DEAD/DEAH box helicase [Acidilobaceae archaeon]